MLISFTFFALIALLSNLILTAFFLFERKKSRVGSFFCLLQWAVSLWIISGVILPLCFEKTYLAFWMRFFYLGLIFLAPLFFHFVLLITSDHTSLSKRMLQAAYGFSFAFVILNGLGWLFKEIVYKANFYYPQVTLIYPVYGLTALFFMGYGTYLLYDRYRLVQNPLEKAQIGLTLIGGCIGSGATLTHTLCSLLDVKIHSVDLFGYLAFNLLINFVAVKYRLIEVHITMKKQHYYSLAAGLLASVFMIGVLAAYFRYNDSWAFVLIGFLLLSLAFTPLLKWIESIMEKFLFKGEIGLEKRLKSLTKVDSLFDKTLLAPSILMKVVEVMGAKNGAILLMEEGRDEYEVEFTVGIKKKSITLSTKHGLLKGLLETKRLLLKEGIRINPRFEDIRLQMEKDFTELEAVVAVPLIREEELIGVLFLGQKPSGQRFDSELDILNALGQEVALTLEDGLVYDKKKRCFLNVMQALIACYESKDDKTQGHSERVARIASLIAQKLGVSSQELENIRLGAFLHDIGKPGSGLEEIKKHPERGVKLLELVAPGQIVLDIIGCHHERIDGKGYPGGLKGEGIPLPARIVAVADGYDSLTSESKKSQEQALEELTRACGSVYDPKIVQVLASLPEL